MGQELDGRARWDLSHLGEAIGDPSRAAMLLAMMGGLALPASDLARAAGVAPSTATSHLQRLVRAGLVAARRQGRHRYFELKGHAVADALERLVALDGREVPRAAGARRGTARDDALALARTCYGHLAGRIAVALWRRAVEQRWVSGMGDAVELLPRGCEALAALLGGESERLVGSQCLDWTERVPHVSGPLGVRLCRALLEEAWVKRVPGTRALRVTTRGERELAALGVRWR